MWSAAYVIQYDDNNKIIAQSISLKCQGYIFNYSESSVFILLVVYSPDFVSNSVNGPLCAKI